MDLKKLEAIKSKAKSAHTQYDINEAVVDLVDALIEHEQADDVEHDKLEKELDKDQYAVISRKK